MWTCRWIAACLSLISGCGFVSQPGLDASTGADVSGPPSLEIGGANDDGIGFLPWHGAVAHPTIIRGVQGGQHIWVSVRARNLWPAKIALDVVLHDELTGALIQPGDIQRLLSLVPYPDGYGYDGFIAYVAAPCAIANRQIRVTMTAADLYGIATQDSAVVIPKWSEPCTP